MGRQVWAALLAAGLMLALPACGTAASQVPPPEAETAAAPLPAEEASLESETPQEAEDPASSQEEPDRAAEATETAPPSPAAGRIGEEERPSTAQTETQTERSGGEAPQTTPPETSLEPPVEVPVEPPEETTQEVPQEVPTTQEDSSVITLTAAGTPLTVEWAENSTVDALRALLEEGELTVTLSDYAGFEKGGPLPRALPQNNTPMDTDAGDIILYQGRQFVIYYDKNSWSLTPLGRITGLDGASLRALLGEGDVTVTLALS
ncbi:MAG: hypothetical protein IJ221_07660 [Oscillibacter sp.]|nr:hypothetical protein [Oscillibacter sp.]